MANPRDSVAPPSPTEASNPVKMHEKFKAITDWIAGLSIGGASVYDTGWQPIALASGFVAVGAQPSWAREGKTLHLRGGIGPSSGAFPGGTTKIGTLAYAPPSQHIALVAGTGTEVAKLQLEPDGSLYVGADSSGLLTYVRVDGTAWKLTV